jgi:hypothetical protein
MKLLYFVNGYVSAPLGYYFNISHIGSLPMESMV